MIKVNKIPVKFDGYEVVLLRRVDTSAWYNNGSFSRDDGPVREFPEKSRIILPQ